VPPSRPPRTALVTGATGGLGREISLRLAREGYRLFLHGRDPGRLDDLAGTAERLGAVRPTILVARFEALGAAAAMCAELESRVPGLDLLINNAGTGFHTNAVTVDGHRSIFQVNYLVPCLLMRRLLPLMRGRRGATILNIASTGQADLPATLARCGDAGEALAYGQSKLALIMATRTLADDLGPRGPRVFALHPGSMLDTGLTRTLLARMPRWVTLAWKGTRRLRPSVEQAARFVVERGLDADEAWPNGSFLTAKGLGRIRPQADDPAARRALQAFTRSAIDCFLTAEPPPSSRAKSEAFAEMDTL
jgi:NAD(P)-dependent dehydrogenase (short-subunit alcohol dehydrogenase family)